MATYTGQGDSIECEKSAIATRQVNNNPPRIKLTDGITLFKYRCGKRCMVKIIEELDPRIHKISQLSFLTIDDSLEGNVIEVYVPKRIHFKLESNFSATHGIQHNESNGFTYAKIIIPWRLFLERMTTIDSPTT